MIDHDKNEAENEKWFTQRCDINRLRPRYRHKYTTYKMSKYDDGYKQPEAMKVRSSTKPKFRQMVQYVPAEKEELKYAEVVYRVGK